MDADSLRYRFYGRFLESSVQHFGEVPDEYYSWPVVDRTLA